MSKHKSSRWLAYLLHDPLATAALVWLVVVVVGAIVGELFLSDLATKQSLRARNLAPFDFGASLTSLLGTDSLGRSMLIRLLTASSTTLTIAVSAVFSSLVVGAVLGIVAGYFGGVVGAIIMRVGDVILSFPMLLLALIVLFVLGPSILNLVLVLTITRIPVYARVARAEVLEIRERLFIDASRTLGAGVWWIIGTHVLPLVMPTLLTVASVNLAVVMLFESGLSFLASAFSRRTRAGADGGAGSRLPSQAWWLACLPGLAIMLTTMACNILASWYRTATDPQQRWRLERGNKQ